MTNKLGDIIKPKELVFNDNYFTLKGDYINNNSGFNFTAYKALYDVNDVKTNNYSNLVLSKKQKNSDILEVTEPNKEIYLNVVTTISFYNNVTTDSMNPGAWLYFKKGFNNYNTNLTTGELGISFGRPESYGNYLFHLECYADYCLISHHFGDLKYYLCYDKGFSFTTRYKDNCKFFYHLDGNIIRLFQTDGNTIEYIKCVRGVENIYTLKRDTTNLYDKDINIYINNIEEILDYDIDASWVTYNRSNYIDSIDTNKSKFDLDSQFLIHHEYFTDNSVNLLPLKNNLTYTGTVTNGANTYATKSETDISKPLVDFRNYTSIHSGINQEYGNETITLSFTFTDQVYHINPGDELVFKIPQRTNTDILPPLYPYESININDTMFVRNGAFASNVPYFADKFKKFQNENTKLNNYTYLCTWLYQPNEDSTPIWLDRYYYPDLVSRNDVLKEERFKSSLNNIPDEYYFTEDYKNSVSGSVVKENEYNDFLKNFQNSTFVDKKSDLTLEAGTTYRYSRLSKEMVDEVYNNISENRIDAVKDSKGNTVNLSKIIPFNGETWRKIPGELFKNSNAINFNMDLYVNPLKKMGIQLFGCDYNYGFNIQNRKDLTPYMYFASKKALYLLNNKFEVRQAFDCYEKYGTEIKYIILDEPFNDVYAFTDDSILVLEYDLRLKQQIKFDSSVIYGLDDCKVTIKDITNNSIIQYNKNLYAAANIYNKDGEISESRVIKIIFNPDSQADKDVLASLKAANPNKTISKFARLLTQDEDYLTNFSCNSKDDLIQTIPEIRTLYIDDKTGKLYAFNYDVVKMSNDGDTIYGVYNNLSRGNGWYYIFNQSLSKLNDDAAISKYAEFSSDISIDNISFGSDGTFGLIRGFNAAPDMLVNDKDKCLEVYDRSKTKIYNYPLKQYTNIISIDYCKYIDDSFNEVEAFVILGTINNNIGALEYRINEQRVIIHNTLLGNDILPTFKNVINGDRVLKYNKENNLYFNLFLPDKDKPITYIWNLKDTQEGWYNINVEINLEYGIFNIKLNDTLVFKADSTTHPELLEKHISGNSIFDNTYYLGTTGKRYGTTLHEILSNAPYDPYSFQHSKANNTTLYNKQLQYYEYQATRLKFNKINPLTITIPRGMRNGIDEIIRYFRYSKVPSISNKVKINISGLSNIESEKELLKQSILDALRDNDCLTAIKEIEFIK